MKSPEEILHVDNWYAFAVLCFAPRVLTPEQAWAAYSGRRTLKIGGDTESLTDTKNRIAWDLRKQGATTPQIMEFLGCTKSAALSYCTRGKRKEEREQRILKGEIDDE